MSEILFALWFYLPAGNANMAPVFASKIKWLDKLNIPIDFGATFRGKRLFGDNKTVRGFVAGYFAAWIAIVLQVWLFNNYQAMRDFSIFDYSHMNIWLFALIFSFGALGGDAIASFFKRQLDIQPGKSWFPFDQIDWILGAVFLSLPFTSFTASIYLWVIVWGLILHPISTVIGWLLKLKDKPI